MLCTLSKEEAAVVNAMSDQAFNILSGAVGSAKIVTALSSIPVCHQTSSMVHAVLNIAILTALDHRMSHGELKDITGLADLKKRPEDFKVIIRDLNDIFAGVLRTIDPEHDYMLDWFKMEKPAEGKDGEDHSA